MRWGLVDFRNNFLSQTGGGLDAIVESTTDGKLWVDFYNNVGTAQYLTREPDGGGGWLYDTKVRIGKMNFLGSSYIGNKSFDYEKVDFSPTVASQESTKVNQINKLYRFLSGAFGVELGGISNALGLTDGHGLFTAEDTYTSTTMGVKSSRTSEFFNVYNFNDTTGLFEDKIFSIRAADGLMNSPGVYVATNGGAANVVVTSDGLVRRSTSSRRWKENERESNLDTTKVFSITPVLFDYKDNVIHECDDDGCPIETTEVGQKDCTSYIAEDVGEFASLDEQGVPDGINWNLITISLVEELKKLRQEFDDFKAK